VTARTPARGAGYRVVVVGSLNVDTRLSVRELPVPGQTLPARRLGRGAGGKGANQAAAAASAGAETLMIGAVGDDEGGQLLLRALAHRGVDTTRIAVRPDHPSGQALVLVDDSAENCILLLAGANHTLDEGTVTAGLHDLAAGDVVLLQNEVPRPAVERAAALGARAGATVIWNAAPAPVSDEGLPTGVHVLVVNVGELATLCGGSGPAEELARTVSQRHRVTVVTTLGPDGALAATDEELVRVSAPCVEAVDTTAAGDTFVGYLAALSHLSPAERIARAAAAGALAVTRHGALDSIPTAADVYALDETP